MEKITLYEIDYSVDRKTTGVTNRQINDLTPDLDDRVPLFSKYQELYYDYLGDNFGLDIFIGDPNSKKTDLLSTIFLSSSGLFISNKFREFLKDFTICNFKYYPVKIKKLSENNEYSYLNLIKCPIVDFEKSEFVVSNWRNPEDDYLIKIKTHKEYLYEINKLQDDKGYGFDIKPLKLIFKEPKDLFKYEITGRKLISQKLKNAIDASNLKGISIEPFKFDCYLDK